MQNKLRRNLILITAALLAVVNCRAVQTLVGGAPEVAATQAVAPGPTDLPLTEEPAQTESAEGAPDAQGTDFADQASALRDPYGSIISELGSLPRYEINLRVDYAGLSFTGSARIDYTNNEDRPLEQIYLRTLPNGGKSYGSGSLSVSLVEINAESMNYDLSLSDTALRVPLVEPLGVGEQLTIAIQFEGRVPEDFGGSETPSGYGIYNYSDGVLALSGWYPILAVYDEDGWNLDPVSAIGDSVYSDMAYYAVTVHLDADLILASTGEEVDRAVDGELAEARLISGPVRDFFLIMSPDYMVSSRAVDGVTVNSYYLPGHEEGGEAALEITSESLRIYNRRFGEYPYTELDVVDGPMRNALGVEYPAIFMVASQLYPDPSDPSFIIATAHEVAHQWWYNVVGNDVFEEPWLDEALTTYSSGVYSQEAIGQDWYQGLVDFWQANYDQLLAEGRDDQVTGSLDYYEAPARRGSYGGVVYTKGALFFLELRDEIGDAAFFSALQSYYQNYRFDIAEGQDLLNAFESAAGRQLDDFYERWLYSAEGS